MATAIEAATDRLNAAWGVLNAATETAAAAGAELARLTLLETEHAVSLTWEEEYQYDDQGGYFSTCSTVITFNDGKEEWEDYEGEIEHMCTKEALVLLCGGVPGDDKGSVEVADLRDKSF